MGAGLSFLLSNTFFFKAELLNFDFLFSVDADNFGFFLPSFFDKVFTFFMTGFPFLATTLDFNFGVFSSVLDELVSLRCFLELLDNLVFLLGGAKTELHVYNYVGQQWHDCDFLPNYSEKVILIPF